MENIDKDHIIRCPYCNREYFPGEIFMPKSFLGSALHLSETLCIGSDMELQETYNCDACNSYFTVEASVTFSSRPTSFGNFDQLYTQK